MKVKELIEKLQEFDDELDIVVLVSDSEEGEWQMHPDSVILTTSLENKTEVVELQ